MIMTVTSFESTLIVPRQGMTVVVEIGFSSQTKGNVAQTATCATRGSCKPAVRQRRRALGVR